MNALIVFATYLPASACFAGATALAWHYKPGWGWLIFAGICCMNVSVKTNSNKSPEVTALTEVSK